MDPFYKVPYGIMSGYQLYRQFKAAERDFEKTEFEKAYRDVLNRLQIQMSTLLHDYDSDIKYYRYGPLDNPSHKTTYDKLYVAFEKYANECTAFLHRVATKLRDKIHQTLDFHYDLSGYKVDPSDNCYNSERYYFDALKDRLKEEQIGKDLLLIAYSPIDFVHFYEGARHSTTPKVKTLLKPPTAKKPRVVPLPVKRPHTPKPYSPKPYIPPTKKSK